MDTRLKIYEEERPWGNFRRFTENTPCTVKIIMIKPGESLSLQSHQKRSEFWRVISGSGECEVDGARYDFKLGDEKMIEVGSRHKLIAKDEGMEVLEIAYGEFDEEDIVRYEDKYGRV